MNNSSRSAAPMLNMRTLKKIFIPGNLCSLSFQYTKAEISLSDEIHIHIFCMEKREGGIYFCALSPRRTSYSSLLCTRFGKICFGERKICSFGADALRFANSSCACGWWSVFVRPIRNVGGTHSHIHAMHPCKQRLFLFLSISLPNTLARRDHYYALRECANGTPLIVSIYEPLHVSRLFNAKSINSLWCKQKGEPPSACFGCARRFWHHTIVFKSLSQR